MSTILILIDDLNLESWTTTDFDTGFLLSSLKSFQKSNASIEIKKILDLTELPFSSQTSQLNISKNWTLVGSKNHIKQDWIFLIHDLNDLNWNDFFQLIQSLKIKDVYINKSILSESYIHSTIETRLKKSLSDFQVHLKVF